MESDVRGIVNAKLRRKKRDPIAVENSACPGTPDVHYINGWIELKILDKWPARRTTIVRPRHYTPQQRVWLRRRWLLAKNAWLLLVVGRDWLLFDGYTAFSKVGKITKEKLFEVAIHVWLGQPSDDEFVDILDNGEQIWRRKKGSQPPTSPSARS